MSAGFEWQADEEEQWITAEKGGQFSPPRRPRWPWFLLLAALLVAAGATGWRLKTQVESVVGATLLDVAASHEVRAQAAANGDRELYLTILSGREPAWTAAQMLLFDRGTLTAGHPFGATDGIGTVVSTTLDSELRQATLLIEQRLVHGATGSELTLLRTDVYRLGRDRWLYAPPDESFWQGKGTLQDGPLTADFPLRDAALAEAISARAAAAIVAACSAIDIPECAQDYALRVVLTPDPLFLQVAAEQRSLLRGGPVLTLPAPSLVGMPLSAADETFLVDLYAQKIVIAALADLSGYPCCLRLAFFLPLVDHQLAALALPPAAVRFPADDRVEALLLIDDPAADLARLWEQGHNQPSNAWLAAAAVDQLLAISGDPAWLWQVRLLDADSFASWLQSGGIAPASFMAGWTVRSLEGVGGEGAQALIVRAGGAPPAGRLVALCRAASSAELVSFDGAGSWRTLLSLPTDSDAEMAFTPLPGERGVVLEQLPYGADESWRTVIWQDGGVAASYAGEGARTRLSATDRFDPAGRRLLMVGRDEDRGFLRFSLLDLDRCAAGQCPLSDVDGLPVWSPDGRRTLLIRGSALDAGDANGVALPGRDSRRGMAPFWLSNDVFGYLRVLRVSSDSGVLAAENGVFVETVGSGEALVGVEVADLLAALPAAERPDRLALEYAVAYPGREDTLLLVAAAPARAAYTLFVISGLRDVARGRSPAGATITVVAMLDMIPTRLQFGPANNGWMAVGGVAAGAPDAGSVHLVNVDSGAVRRYSTYLPAGNAAHWLSWSSDGGWLGMVGAGAMQWVEPAGDGRIWVDFPEAHCSAAAWIDPP